MIFELYGLPGAGKSFLISQLNGHRDIGLTSSNGVKNTIYTIVKKMSLVLPSSLVLRRKIVKACGEIPSKPKYLSQRKGHYIDILVMTAFGYKHLKSRNIYMDEGLIHRILGFVVNYDLSSKTLIDLMECLEPYINLSKAACLDTTVDDCFQSIRSRDRHECEMDEMDDETLKKYLSDFQDRIMTINQRYNYLQVTRDNYEGIRDWL